ncbi:hypothetical protein B7463_g8263, partial [Scytalidium lignicola]
METDYGIERPRIPKLDGLNYRSWSVQVKELLIGQNLWDVVSMGVIGQPPALLVTPPPRTTPSRESTPGASSTTSDQSEPQSSGQSQSGTTPEPESTTTNRTRAKDANANTIIMGYCNHALKNHILGKKSAKERWEALKTIYAPMGKQQLGAKLQAFQAYQPPKTNAFVITIATELDTLQAEIEDIDPSERPSDSAKVQVLFRAVKSLNNQFDPLILQIEISMESTSNYEFIVAKFMDMERCMGTAKEFIKEGAFSVSFSVSDKPQKFKGKCFYCGKIGHKKEDCRKLKKEGKSPSTGLLPTLSGSKPEAKIEANKATEQSWMATTTETASSGELLWIIDSGASRHMTYSREAFREYSELPEPIAVQTAGGAEIWAIGQGTVPLKVALKELAGSLISVLQLQDKDILIQTTRNKGGQGKLLILRNGKVIGEAQRLGKLYTLKSTLQEEQAFATTIKDAGKLWHRRLGHLSVQGLQSLHTVTTGLGHPITTLQEPCEPCTLVKAVRVVNRERPERVSKPLERIHSDIWGPYKIPSIYGNVYMVTFTDEIFTEFKAEVELETGLKIKAVRCDNVSEYKALGKKYAKFWEDAVVTTSYLRNRTPIGPEGKTPEEIYTGKQPYIGHLRAFGCVAYPTILPERRSKLESTAIKTCFIGYLPSTKHYKLYNPHTEPVVGEEIAVFDLMELPEAHEATEPIGEDVLDDTIAPEASELTFDSGEPEELSELNFELENNAESELNEDTIVVDTGNGEPWEPGNTLTYQKGVTCQSKGDDYLETFSPTIRPESLKTLLAIGVKEDLEIRQIDVVSVYPRAKLHATIYMRAPICLKIPGGKVLLLRKLLYGLKQSGREWHIEASTGLETLGFRPCYSDPSIFVNADRSLIIGVYVDDMVVMGKDLQAVQKTIDGIAAKWDIKDMGPVNLILGLQITRDRPNRTLRIDQSQYINRMIARFRLQESKPVTLPASDRNTLIKGSDQEMEADQALYQEAIGQLGWVAKGTRFDIGFVVGQLQQQCRNPKIRHWNSALKVMRYLKGTVGYALIFGPKPQGPKLQGYCDADYAGDIVDRRSTTGHIYILYGGAVSWTSTKQRC